MTPLDDPYGDVLDVAAGKPPTPRKQPKQPLDLIEQYESGGQNVRNYRYDPGHTAQGNFQITNSTWRGQAPRAGVDTRRYPNAMSAPYDVQRQVAGSLFSEQGYKPWAPYNPRLRAALQRGEGGAQQPQQPQQPRDPYADIEKIAAGQTGAAPYADVEKIAAGGERAAPQQPDATAALQKVTDQTNQILRRAGLPSGDALSDLAASSARGIASRPDKRTRFQVPVNGPRRIQPKPQPPAAPETITAPGGSVPTEPGGAIPQVLPQLGAPTMSSVLQQQAAKYEPPQVTAHRRLRNNVRQQVADERSFAQSIGLPTPYLQNPITAVTDTLTGTTDQQAIEAETDRRTKQIEDDEKEAMRVLTDPNGDFRQDVLDRYNNLLQRVKSDPNWWRSVDVGVLEGDAGIFRTVAGMLRYAYSPAADELQRRALVTERAMQQLREDVPLNKKEQAARLVTKTVIDLAQLGLATELAGPVGGFAAHGALQAAGAGLPLGNVVEAGAESAAIGAGFAGAPLARRAGASALENFARESGVIAGTTGAVGTVAGRTPAEIAQETATNIAFHGAGQIPRIYGAARERLRGTRGAPPTPEAPAAPFTPEQQAAASGAQVLSQPGEKLRVRMPTTAALAENTPTPPETIDSIVAGITAPTPKKTRATRANNWSYLRSLADQLPDSTTKDATLQGFWDRSLSKRAAENALRALANQQGIDLSEPGTQPVHHSEAQNRRVRTTETGTAGQFRAGYKAEAGESVEYEGYKYTKKPDGRWYGGPNGKMVTDTNKVQELEFNLSGEAAAGAPAEKPAQSDIGGIETLTPAEQAEVNQQLTAEHEPDTVLNLITGKTMKLSARKKRGGGFINVGEIQDAIQSVLDRYPQMDEKDAREYLEIRRPNLFKPGVGRAEEKQLDYADQQAKAAEFRGSQLDNAEAEYTRTLKAIRADYPDMSPDAARKWVAENRPELMRQLEGDFGVQPESYLRGRTAPSPTEAAEQFAKQSVREAYGSEQGGKKPRGGEEGYINIGEIRAAIRKLADEKQGDTRYVAYNLQLPGKEHPIYISGEIGPDGTADIYALRSAREEPGITRSGIQATFNTRTDLGMDGVLALKRFLQSEHPEVKRVTFDRAGTTGGFKGRLVDVKLRPRTDRSGEGGFLNLEAIRGLQEDLAKLHEHSARTKGLTLAPRAAVSNYLDKLFDVVSEWAPDKTNLVHDAYAFYEQGNTTKAVASSEAALSAVHARYSRETVEAQRSGVQASELRALRNEDWRTVMDAVKKRVSEGLQKLHEEETGAIRIFNPKKYPPKGRPNTEVISHKIEPAVEKLWTDANKRIAEGKLKTSDLKAYVANEFETQVMPRLKDEGWHILNRGAAQAVAMRRISQIAGERPGAKTAEQAATYESRHAAWQAQVNQWKALNDLLDKDPAKLAAMAKQKYPETYRKSEEQAIDRFFRAIMPEAKAKRAGTWQEEVMNRLNATEKALDKEAAARASVEPTAAQQAAALGGGTPRPRALSSVPEPERQQVHKLWETLAESGREPGTERTYPPDTRERWRTEAEKLVREHGTELARDWYDSAPRDNPVRTIVGKLLGDHYEIEAASTGDAALRQRAVEFSNERVLGAADLGRAVKAFHDYNEPFDSPSGAVQHATNLYRRITGDPDSVLPPEMHTDIVGKGKRAQDAAKKVADLTAKVAAEPEQPAPRKPKLIKRLLGGEQGGFVRLPRAIDESAQLIAARKAKAAKEKDFTAMEKAVGRFWNKASYPDLERARIELRDARYDLLKTYAALEQRGDHSPFQYWKRSMGIFRASMVSAWPTAFRNAVTQTGRFMLERATDASELSAVSFNNLLRKNSGLDTDLTWKGLWRDTKRVFEGNTANIAQQILREHPEQYNRMFNIYAGDVTVPLPSDLAKGLDKVFLKTERGYWWANYFNRIQEFHIRSAEFLSNLDLRLQKSEGLSLEEFVARHGGEHIPQKLIEQAIDKALDVTFANKPSADTAMGQTLNSVINVANLFPPTMSPAPFARFMYNQLKFLYEYNPVGGAVDVLRLARKNVKLDDRIASITENPALSAEQKASRIGKLEDTRANIPRAIGKWMLGNTMFGLAYALRSDKEIAGEKWYEFKIGDQRVDARPFGPFSIYLFMADAVRRYHHGERMPDLPETLQALGASTSYGGLSEATIERIFNYMAKANFDKAFQVAVEGAKTEVGEAGRALLTPVKQLKDIAAQFSQEEATRKDTKEAPITGPIRESIPFASRGLPAAYKPTSGKPVAQQQPIVNYLTGIRVEQPKSFIEKEIDRLHMTPDEVRPKYTGNPRLDRLISQHTGEMLDRAAQELANNPRYQQANDKLKYIILRAQLQGAHAAGTARAAGELPDDWRQYKLSQIPKWKRDYVEAQQAAPQ